MNQLIYNFLNEIEDTNKIKEMSLEEFTKLVKSNNLISEDDAKQLIESFKKISSAKNEEDANDSDQRKKKYRQQHKETNLNVKETKQQKLEEKEQEDNSIER